jgi:hypothetical protein
MSEMLRPCNFEATQLLIYRFKQMYTDAAAAAIATATTSEYVHPAALCLECACTLSTGVLSAHTNHMAVHMSPAVSLPTAKKQPLIVPCSGHDGLNSMMLAC